MVEPEASAIRVPAGTTLVLASGSPRRLELLRRCGLDPVVRPPGIEEIAGAGERPTEYVRRLSAEKAAAVARPGDVVVAADTTIEIDDRILEKPVDDDDARRMLRFLSGRLHHAHTAVTVRGPGGTATQLVSTAVRFVELDAATIDWYVGTGEAADKAGAYAIQGAGAALVAGVDGSVSNVIGLPLAETLAMLRHALG